MAWARFLRASLQRSAETRQARPEIVRQARRWGVAGGAAWLLACQVGRRRANSVDRASGLLWWFAVWRMLDWHLGMAESPDGIRRARLSGADALSLARIWLVPLLPALRRAPGMLSTVIVAGGVTDALDGELARRQGCTRLGRDLDTAADVCFLGSSAASARAAGRLPAAGAWALGIRYGLGIGFSVADTFRSGGRPQLAARRWGAVLRVGGLALAARGWRRSGTAALLVGCLVPPRSALATGAGGSPAPLAVTREPGVLLWDRSPCRARPHPSA